MAIAASVVWRIRVAGNDLNGAGYDSTSYPGGTDYSQQDAAQASWTNLATSAANSTTVTSASATFTAAMVGNCINLASGTNAVAGFYFITAYTNSTTVTVDRTPATAGALSGGTGRLGGAHASLQTYTDASKVAGLQYTAGNTVYVRGSGQTNPTSADYNYASWVSSSINGDSTNGYIKWISENGRACIGHCGLMWFAGGSAFAFSGMKFMQTSLAQSGYGVTTGSGYYDDCIFDQNGNDAIQLNLAGGSVTNCEFINTGTTTAGAQPAFASGGWGGVIAGCIFHELKGPAIQLAAGDQLTNCLVLNNGGDGIIMSNQANNTQTSSVMNCTIDGNAGHGINLGSTQIYLMFVFMNNIISNHTGSGKFGMYAPSHTLAQNNAMVAYNNYNVYYNNTTNTSTNLSVGSHSTIGTDPSYTSRSTEDMRIGTAMKALGFPNAFKNNASGMTAVTNYEDPGALQRQESAGGLTQAEVYFVS